MTIVDLDLLAEKAAAVERHLIRVADKLPSSAMHFRPATDESDAVILHLWQATQIVIDLAMSCTVRAKLGTPKSYAEAFRQLARAGLIPDDLADNLAKAAGFRNVIAHAYESIDMLRIHEAAAKGPADLRRFLRCMRDA